VRSQVWAPKGDMATLVESIHRLDLSDATWLQGIAVATEALLPRTDMVLASRFSWNHETGVLDVTQVGSTSTQDSTLAQETAHLAEQEFLKKTLRAGRPVFTLRQLFGASLDGFSIGGLMGTRGLEDMLFAMSASRTNGMTTGVGCAAGSGTQATLSRQALRSWQHIVGHLGAASRLRSNGASPVEGVLSPDGRLLDAQGAASEPTSREALRRAALGIERARLRDRRTDIDALLDAWRAVYERRWTLVETVESDGRRLLLARVNPPPQQSIQGATERQQQVAALLAQGIPQKVIAFDLQIAPSTVAFHVRRLAATLGISTVPALVARLRERASGADRS